MCVSNISWRVLYSAGHFPGKCSTVSSSSPHATYPVVVGDVCPVVVSAIT